MDEQSFKIRLTKKQAQFLLELTKEKDLNEALDLMKNAMLAELVSPTKIPEYIDKIMQRERR